MSPFNRVGALVFPKPTMRSWLPALAAIAVGCASAPLPPPSAPLPPLPRSSIAAVLDHRGELKLSDDQVQRLSELDDELDRENRAIHEEVERKKQAHLQAINEAAKGDDGLGQGGTRPDGNSSSGGMGGGMNGGMGGSFGSRGGARGSRQRTQSGASLGDQADQKIDDNDTHAYLEAEGSLEEAQRTAARDIASQFRAQLYERRRKLKAQNN
jgi:hypothetical protein